jgi:Ca-activated chloride channel homolog
MNLHAVRRHRAVAKTGAFAIAVMATVSLFATDTQNAAPCGWCYAAGRDGERVYIPLESTEVVLDVKPGLMEAQVIQTFTNRSDAALEAIYAYPLPHDATLTSFELRFRDRVITSIVREKTQARADYEAAKVEGRKAALLEQHDATLFSTSVANFLPGETVEIVIRFIQPLRLAAGSLEVRFPMVSGDKYFPAATQPGTAGAAAPNPARVPRDLLAQKHVYAFDVEVAGLPVQAVESPSHRIQVENCGGDRRRVALAEEVTVPDRDFLLRIALRASASIEPTLVTQHTQTGDYGLLAVFPPATRSASAGMVRGRDILFLLDRSGSMQGSRLDGAKLGLETCLKALFPEDRFCIEVFADSFQFHGGGWTQASPQAVSDAVAYVRRINVGGGTEMQPAIEAGLRFFEAGDRDQVLILLTDGDVGNPDSLLTRIEANIGHVRLFTLGIGSAPNAALLNKVAELGRGQARFIGDAAAIERELADLFLTLDAPVLTCMRLTLLDSAGQVMEHAAFPAVLPDAFVGRPVETVFRTTAGVPARVVMEAVEGGRPVRHELPLLPTPLRGDGLEKQFGRRWYAAQEDMARRAGIESVRAEIRGEMLQTALEFGLVTPLTSRVAVEQQISRDPNAPLRTQNVAQYVPADHVGAGGGAGSEGGGGIIRIGPDGEEVIELSPFCVDTEAGDGTYATSSLAGTRLRTDLRDVASAISVITADFLRDVAPTALEQVLPYAMLPEQDPELARTGVDTGLLDGLPIATVVDRNTVRRVALQSSGPAWTDISQAQSGGPARNAFTVRAGDEGLLTASLESSCPLDASGRAAALAIVSWARLGQEQTSAFFDARTSFGEDRLRGSMQWRDLRGYGGMRMARAMFEHKLSDAIVVEATGAWHQLTRDDPRQFRLGSATTHYDGLGFFNLDQLTDETRRLEDVFARVQVLANMRGRLAHAASVRASWHRRWADWAGDVADGFRASRCDSASIDAFYRVTFAEGVVGVETFFGAADHRTPLQTVEQQRTRTMSAGFFSNVTSNLTVFGNWTQAEMLPWLSGGRFALVDGRLAPIAAEIEQRDGVELGLRGHGWNGVFSGQICFFRETICGSTYRDWDWEQAHPLGGVVDGNGGEVRSAVAYDPWRAFARHGFTGSLDLNPTRSITATASAYVDAKDAGPVRGGNRRASLAVRYEIREGVAKGLIAGFGLSRRNAMTFNDGFSLPGGSRVDALLAYRRRNHGGHETLLQVNVLNLAGRAWKPTRFAPDRGRQLVLSIVREF